MPNRIVLGSGKLYVAEYTGTIPDDATIEVETNILGYIKGGASIAYTPEYLEVKDDLGYVSKRILTTEKATLKSGIMTISVATLKKLISTGVLTETATERTLKIGGWENYKDTKYVVHFVHEDAIDGDIKITIIGSNNTGFELAFAKEGETVINAEFSATPLDDKGTLIIYKEMIPQAV